MEGKEETLAGSIQSFKVNIPNEDLDDLRHRLRRTKWPPQETAPGWTQGVPLESAKDLVNYWLNQYDMTRCEKWFNSWPQYTFSFEGEEIHFLHIKSKHKHTMPLLLLHGWPGSVLEFRNVIGPLTDPTRHGGEESDAFDLVIPSLPGYGWSTQPTESGWSLRRMVKAMKALMAALKYDAWVAQGGDWGADIVALLASESPPSSLKAVHLGTAFFDATKEIQKSVNPSPEEIEAVGKQAFFDNAESAYFKLQATRPQTIGYSLSDSPVGLAMWIYEKLHNWTDPEGDVDELLGRDEILDNIMLYWLSGTATSSARLYWEDDDNTALPIDIPVGMSIFPKDISSAAREWGERYYKEIVHWKRVERGGHFAAWEVPELFVQELCETFRHVRRCFLRALM